MKIFTQKEFKAFIAFLAIAAVTIFVHGIFPIWNKLSFREGLGACSIVVTIAIVIYRSMRRHWFRELDDTCLPFLPFATMVISGYSAIMGLVFISLTTNSVQVAACSTIIALSVVQTVISGIDCTIWSEGLPKKH